MIAALYVQISNLTTNICWWIKTASVGPGLVPKPWGWGPARHRMVWRSQYAYLATCIVSKTIWFVFTMVSEDDLSHLAAEHLQNRPIYLFASLQFECCNQTRVKQKGSNAMQVILARQKWSFWSHKHCPVRGQDLCRGHHPQCGLLADLCDPPHSP